MFANSSGVPTVLCCVCGASMPANPANMCVGCLQSHVDITSAISKEATVQFCKFCERYLQPPKYWVAASLESKELLTLCLKRVKGLSKVHLVDACFLWTEPHCKRLKVKLVVQKELFTGTIIQQNAVVEYIVMNQMCDMCQKAEAGQETWQAKVQARQKVDHKRTFFYLEQLILRNKMHAQAIKVQEFPDGLDFAYSHRGHALHMIDFLGSLAPIKWQHAEQLVSHDSKSNTANVRHTYALDIAPLCREDLVCLPVKYCQAMGGFGPLALVMRVNSGIVLMDLNTLQVTTIPGNLYWKAPFESLAAVKQATIFYVMEVECEQDAPSNGRYTLAEAVVCKENEVGKGKLYTCRTHLGNHLEPGDYAVGYNLVQMNFNSDIVPQHRGLVLPDVVLVRKHFPTQAKQRTKRKWDLAEIPKELCLRKGDMEKRAQDKEEFLDELEREPEVRREVTLRKRKDVPLDTQSEMTDDDDVPRVPHEEIHDSDAEEEDDEEWEEEEEEEEEGEGEDGAMQQ
eukprot:GGOE01036462.1.p1 GENE.GGOE01036462.1~~GGOE01036462.1.p1  ORF type:complete len:512 (-),score=188.59 GGOE01036462.1:132-1667(-)